MQTLWLALRLHLFCQAIAASAQSRAHGICRSDVIERVPSLPVRRAGAKLRRARPVRLPVPRNLPLEEGSDNPLGSEKG